MISKETQVPKEDNRINFLDASKKKRKNRWERVLTEGKKMSKEQMLREKQLAKKFRIMSNDTEEGNLHVSKLGNFDMDITLLIRNYLRLVNIRTIIKGNIFVHNISIS